MSGRWKQPKHKNVRPSPDDHAPVLYPIARDRFLGNLKSIHPDEEVVWLVEVGRFVQDRWMAEERLRQKDTALDEEAVWDEWDKCTEVHFRDLRTDAGTKLKGYVDRQRVAAVKAWWNGYGKDLPSKVGKFILKGVANSLISAVTLILIGSLILWLGPGLVKMARSRFDLLMPASTQPDRLGSSPGSPAAQPGATEHHP